MPKTTSGQRRYVPIGFEEPDTIASHLVFIIPEATLYTFSILSSNVHNAWIRTVAGRLKSDFRYTGSVVYNTFPWPDPTEMQKNEMEKAAKNILDIREKYSDNSLADLYDDLTMPLELRKAHQMNDRAVMKAFGFSIKDMSESDCIAALMKLYQKKIEEK